MPCTTLISHTWLLRRLPTSYFHWRHSGALRPVALSPESRPSCAASILADEKDEERDMNSISPRGPKPRPATVANRERSTKGLSKPKFTAIV
jgi:hypothetical protein